MNPLLERIHFFRLCEAVVARILPGALRPDSPALLGGESSRAISLSARARAATAMPIWPSQ